VVVDGMQQDATRRVSLVQAGQIVGSFGSIEVKGEGRKASRCYSYFAGPTNKIDGTMTVLIVAKEKTCSSAVRAG
jgi:hypothetical protein